MSLCGERLLHSMSDGRDDGFRGKDDRFPQRVRGWLRHTVLRICSILCENTGGRSVMCDRRQWCVQHEEHGWDICNSQRDKW